MNAWCASPFCLLEAPSDGAILAPQPFALLSLLPHRLRTVLAIKGSLRRATARPLTALSVLRNHPIKRERVSTGIGATSAPFWPFFRRLRHLLRYRSPSGKTFLQRHQVLPEVCNRAIAPELEIFER